jgi:hypothetical protein
MPRIRIDSTNYSGQSGVVTFYSQNNPSTPIDLGLRLIPYTRNDSNVYGTYQIYFGDFDKICYVVADNAP